MVVVDGVIGAEGGGVEEEDGGGGEEDRRCQQCGWDDDRWRTKKESNSRMVWRTKSSKIPVCMHARMRPWRDVYDYYNCVVGCYIIQVYLRRRKRSLVLEFFAFFGGGMSGFPRKFGTCSSMKSLNSTAAFVWVKPGYIS